MCYICLKPGNASQHGEFLAAGALTALTNTSITMKHVANHAGSLKQILSNKLRPETMGKPIASAH